MIPQTLLGLLSISVVLCLASAAVARAAARDARADLRNLILAMERMQAENEGLLVRLRRIEGRQTARLGRDRPADPNALPDPLQNPDAWRAAVRRMAIQKPNKELQ